MEPEDGVEASLSVSTCEGDEAGKLSLGHLLYLCYLYLAGRRATARGVELARERYEGASG